MSVLSLKENVFQLPSLGLAYDLTKVPLISGDSVQIRPLTVGDQRHLATTGGNAYQAYFNLMSRVIVEPKIDVDELLLDDLTAILFAVRVRSYGSTYSINFHCSECGKENSPELELTELEVKDAEDVPNYKTEGLEIELNGTKVTLHQLRLKDEKMINRHLQSLKKTKHITNEAIDRVFVRFAQCIDNIEGMEFLTIQNKMEFIDGLSPNDMDKLIEFQNANSVGIIPTVFAACYECGFENDVNVAVWPDFFRSR